MDLAWLKAPYPFEHSYREKWNTIIITSIFLSIITILLQPFGFAAISRLQVSGSYMLIAFFSLSFNYFSIPYFFPEFFKEEKWSVKKAFFFLAYNFILIGFWNHIFNGLVIRNDPVFTASGYELMITVFRVLLIGSIASIFLILTRYNFLSRKHLQISQELNQQMQKQLSHQSFSDEKIVHFNLENKPISVVCDNLVYISSEGNYVAFHLSQSKKGVPSLFRGRIKEIEEVLSEYPIFFRCHRSYIINLNYVESTAGNSQGLAVKLNSRTEKIPVARPKIKELKYLLNQKMQ